MGFWFAVSGVEAFSEFEGRSSLEGLWDFLRLVR